MALVAASMARSSEEIRWDHAEAKAVEVVEHAAVPVPMGFVAGKQGERRTELFERELEGSKDSISRVRVMVRA